MWRLKFAGDISLFGSLYEMHKIRRNVFFKEVRLDPAGSEPGICLLTVLLSLSLSALSNTVL